MLAVSVEVLVSLVFVCFAQDIATNHSVLQLTKDAADIKYITTDNLDGQVELSTLNILTTTAGNGDDFSTEEYTTHKYRKVLKHILKRPIHTKDVNKNDEKTNKQSEALIAEEYSQNGEVSAKEGPTDVPKSDDLMNGFTTTSGNLNDDSDLKELVVKDELKDVKVVNEGSDKSGAIEGQESKKDYSKNILAHSMSEVDQHMGDEPTTTSTHDDDQPDGHHKLKKVLLKIIKRPVNSSNVKELDSITQNEPQHESKDVEAYTLNEIGNLQISQDKNLDTNPKTLNGTTNSITEQEKLFTGNVTKEEESLFEVADTTENDLFDVDEEEINAAMSAFKRTQFPTVLFPKHLEEENTEKEVNLKSTLISSSTVSIETSKINDLNSTENNLVQETTTPLGAFVSTTLKDNAEITTTVNTGSSAQYTVATTLRQMEQDEDDFSVSVNSNQILTFTTEMCPNSEITVDNVDITTNEQPATSTISSDKNLLIKHDNFELNQVVAVEETNKNDLNEQNPVNNNMFSEENLNNIIPTIPLLSEDVLHLIPGVDEDISTNKSDEMVTLQSSSTFIDAQSEENSTTLTTTILLDTNYTPDYTTEDMDLNTFVTYTTNSERSVSTPPPTVIISEVSTSQLESNIITEIPSQTKQIPLLISDNNVTKSDKSYEFEEDEINDDENFIGFQNSEFSTTPKPFSLPNNVMKIPNPKKLRTTTEQPLDFDEKKLNTIGNENIKDYQSVEDEESDKGEIIESQSSDIVVTSRPFFSAKNVMQIPKAASKIDEHQMDFFKVMDNNLEGEHQSDSPVLNVTFIVSNIFGITTNYSIEIILDGKAMFVPHDAAVFDEKGNRTLKFTWHSHNLTKNNSIFLNLTENENKHCGIQLTLVKDDTPNVWSDNDIKCPSNDHKWIIQFGSVQITFYNIRFYDSSDSIANLDALAAEERYETRMFHIKISAGICAILAVVGVLFFIIVKKRQQKKNSANLETKNA